MAFDLALLDLISPYVLRGDSFGQWHAALSVIYVSEHTVTVDDSGVVIRGVARFSGHVHPYLDPPTMTFGVNPENTEGHPANDPGRRDPWIDVRDSHIDFELNVPRVASQKVSDAISTIAGSSFAPIAAVINAYDNNPGPHAPPSDYPGTEFVLDLLLTTVVLRPPFLRGAKLESSGQLVADPVNTQVKFTLPRIKVRLAQGSGTNDPLTATLLSFGATGLDDPGDLSVAELVTMDPPYAFIGPWDIVGFGFRSATLDLSTGSTPPDVLSQFGFDESWTGLYLPEIRLFVAPHGAEDLAVDAGAHNLLIGFGASAGITGDFDLTVLDQGASPLHLSARFYDAAGRCFGITKTSETTAMVALPDHTRMVIDIDGGLTPYTANAKFDSHPPQPGRLFDFDLSSNPTRTIMISAIDSRPGATEGTLTIIANRRPSSAPVPPGSTQASENPAAQLQTTSITQGSSLVLMPQLRLVSETPNSATIALDTDVLTAAQTHWTVDGIDRGTGATVTVNLPPGANSQVKAELLGATAVSEFTAYYRFDRPVRDGNQPPATNTETAAFAIIGENTHTAPAPDGGQTSPWPTGSDAGTALKPLLDALPYGTNIVINGYASYETGGAAKLAYNTDLARRRAIGLQAIIQKIAPSKGFTFNPYADMSHWPDQGDPVRKLFWKAVASWPTQHAPGTTTEGIVSRPQAQPITPVPVPDNPTNTTSPPPPSWFKQIGIKVRIVRNHFVACEVFGKFDIQTALENQLQQGGVAGQDIPTFKGLGSQNPADGLIDIRLVVQIDDATDTLTVTGYLGADPADRDGLMMWPSSGQQLQPPSKGLNYFGMAIVFMPLLSATSSAVSGDGALAEIAVTEAVLSLPFTLVNLGWINVQRVIWYGGEITVQNRPDGVQATVLLDLETAFSADVKIGSLRLLRIRDDAPLQVRYKAVGLLIGNPPGQPKFQFRPVFDSSKGYTIDVSRPGAIEVADPLGEILQILGARIARTNPLTFEVDLGFAIDLGVISIERARVRMKLDPPGIPELTAFAASVDIPDALKGRGYLELNEVEIKGQLDLTLVPMQVRVVAGIGIANIPPDKGGPATGAIVTLDVEFPVAIPLLNSGLGIYGFLGLFAMNYARDESAVPSDNMAPALAWLKATGGDPTNIAFWKPQVNTWAFGVGAILGIMGSSIIFNLKGVILLELPGPRLLLMMKANLLKVMPELNGPAEGTFLAVMDLDMGRGTLTIGISVDFEVDPLLIIKIPVEAFFKFNDTSNWHFYLGQYVNQVHAKVFQVFDASGYLMLSGSGIPSSGQPSIPNLPAVTGFSIAAGLHVSFVWGETAVGLYARLTAGFDAIVGFTPFRMAGILYVRGTLHLFILDISAWADLRVDIGDDGMGGKIARIDGDICGKVEFLFFSIEGCVSFSLGADAVPLPDPPDLVKSLKLISRSPALVMGTGVDKPIDSSIGEGVQGGDTQPDTLPVVPIDAIPVLMMTMPPLQRPGLKFLGQDINGTPEAPADGFVKRGDVWFKYTITNIELIGPVTAGKAPATWWKSKSGDKALEAQLALLSWVPEATPKAIGSSKYLDETVKELWGTVCQPAAPPAPVFWTFLNELLGSSDTGWRPDGTAWPDPAKTTRSSPADLHLQVTERWRCSDKFMDKLRGIVPAQIEGKSMACPDETTPPTTTPTTKAKQHLRPSEAQLRAIGSIPPANVAINRPPVLNNPIAAILGGVSTETIVPNEALTLSDAVQRFSLGQPVARATLARLALSRADLITIGEDKLNLNCFGRALASPIFDDGEVVAFGSPSRKGTITAAWSRLHYKPGPLDDAVVFETGEFMYARFYIWVPLRYIELKTVVVEVSDAQDKLFTQHVVNLADRIPPLAFPPSWNDASGPWYKDVMLLTEMQGMQGMEMDYVGMFVEVKGEPGADHVQIGLLPNSRELRGFLTERPFYVAAVEVLRKSEMTRFDYDIKESKKKQGVLQQALGLESADNALLQQGQAYQVRITWDGARERRSDGQPPTDQKSFSGQQKSFWFQKDSKPPARLDPWVLVSLPGEGENHFFASEAIKVVFATNNLGLIYDAYGKKLQARLKPSSFRSVPSTPTVPHPYPLNTTNLKYVKASVLSPWEDAVQNLVNDTCVPVSGERIRHSMITMPIPLDLDTDYVIDIEILDKNAPNGTLGDRVWRGSFSTGGFRTIDEFASSFQVARIAHRGVHSDDLGKLQAIGTTFSGRDPQGQEFDTALIQAGLDPQPVASSPHVIIFWDPVAPDPQPAALLVDSSEPIWRSRSIPTEVTDPGPAASKRYELQPAPWLKLVQQTGGDDIVDNIVRAPGGQRALVTLKPNSRGKRINLALQRIAHKEPYLDGSGAMDQFFTVLDMQLIAAPWEEVN